MGYKKKGILNHRFLRRLFNGRFFQRIGRKNKVGLMGDWDVGGQGLGGWGLGLGWILIGWGILSCLDEWLVEQQFGQRIKINIKVVMSRQPSFSRNGMNLDANLHASIRRKDPSQILKLLKTKPSSIRPHRHNHQNPQKPSPLSQTITRQTLSSFQKCHCPVQNVNAIYNQKIQLTKKRRQHYSMKKFVPVSYFETVSEFYRKEHDEQEGKACDKLLNTMRSEKFIKTQSQSGLKISDSINKSKLLIPFQKQTERFRQNYLRRLERQALDRPFSPQTQKKKQLTQRQRKMKKTHAFESYESHNLLNPEKVRSFSSAMNIHNVDLKNFKQPNRKSHMKFDKFVDKIATRYDRDSTPWLVKLTYDAKDEVIRGEKGTREFSKQSSRKMNQVHSKYPMRIAM